MKVPVLMLTGRSPHPGRERGSDDPILGLPNLSSRLSAFSLRTDHRQAALCGFLYGYDTDVVGVALLYVGTAFGGKALTAPQQEIAVVATTIGSIFGAAILGFFADRWGRKRCLLISEIL